MVRRKGTKDLDWIVLDTKAQGIRCERCGRSRKLFPCNADDLSRWTEEFLAEHGNCLMPQVEPEPEAYATPLDWIVGDDTGISSVLIWSVMMGTKSPYHTNPPSDPGDFGRCYRLLEAFPEWKARLGEVSDRFPEWKSIIGAWPSLTALFEEEQKNSNGMAPKLYEEMKKLWAA